ncbi:MAG: cation-translocating P-type ATPase [Halanaerobium sp.]|nr:cation-translocating P-type ATPase [Halanaerobium sp.]
MGNKLKLVITAGAFIIAGWLSQLFHLNQLAFDIPMVIAALNAGYPVAKSAYQTIKMKVISINTLVTIAATGAIIIGEYWEAAAVTFLFAFGDYLKARTIGKTRNAIKSLMEMSPTRAVVRRNGKEHEIPAGQVKPGETVVIKPGQKVPVDGEVLQGNSAVNQAAITGESIPVRKEAGSEVFSGSINEDGYLEVAARKVGEDTTFARIIKLVEEAQEEKAPTQALIERFSRYYTPGIILLAIISYVFSRDIRLALTLLVIGCPGALVISTPISIVAGIGNAARNGVLIKGGDHLEKAGEIDLVTFDKTGTLTRGRPAVTDIIPYSGGREDVLRIAAAAERNSEHHLARAILTEARDRLEELPSGPEEFSVLTGQGVKARFAKTQVLVGNSKLLEADGIIAADKVKVVKNQLEEEGKTTVYVVVDKEVQGLIAIADIPRDKAKETIAELKDKGIKRVMMLTGDSGTIASAIARELNLDDFKAGLLPEDKVAAIKKLQKEGHTVAMVGDGINDAPSLAAADTGIAMGAAGTDAAIDTADITLMADKIEKIPFAIGLSKATAGNIKQNISFAVLVVFLLLAGVLGKKVFLASGMLVHEASVLIVTLNAMRLFKYGRR